jgi:PIN domain nuclease of toxin-antitoxin system
LSPSVLLDTHILIHWLADPKRLSRNQLRILDGAVRRSQQVAISAITLLEVAVLADRISGMKLSIDELFDRLETNPVFRILPLTIEIARETSFLGSLRDPADRVIAATARVHGLRLLTSDRRIVESNVVSAVD